jgi:hypothetical protein
MRESGRSRRACRPTRVPASRMPELQPPLIEILVSKSGEETRRNSSAGRRWWRAHEGLRKRLNTRRFFESVACGVRCFHHPSWRRRAASAARRFVPLAGKSASRRPSRPQVGSPCACCVHADIEHVCEGNHGARCARHAIAIGPSKARREGWLSLRRRSGTASAAQEDPRMSPGRRRASAPRRTPLRSRKQDGMARRRIRPVRPPEKLRGRARCRPAAGCPGAVKTRRAPFDAHARQAAARFRPLPSVC